MDTTRTTTSPACGNSIVGGLTREEMHLIVAWSLAMLPECECVDLIGHPEAVLRLSTGRIVRLRTEIVATPVAGMHYAIDDVVEAEIAEVHAIRERLAYAIAQCIRGLDVPVTGRDAAL